MKQPWQMTKEEMVRERIAEHQARLDEIAALAPDIQGNLTRRKDHSDLRQSADYTSKYAGTVKMYQEKIAMLKNPQAVNELTRIHRDIVEKAVKSGKPVPYNVRSEYGLSSLRDRIALAAVRRELGFNFDVYYKDDEGQHHYDSAETVEEAQKMASEAKGVHPSASVGVFDRNKRIWLR